MKNNYNTLTTLPEKGILFLGGHQNMVKKLRQLFPKWTYVPDDKLRRYPNINHKIVFYWTKHSSHSKMEHVYSKLPNDAVILYVTATNISMLINEMQHRYQCNNTVS